MLERTMFFGLPLAGVGTSRVESFRSYVQRLALAHCMKPRALVETLLEHFPWAGPMFNLGWMLKWWEVHGAGQLGVELRERFGQATGVDLARGAFGAFSGLVAGQHLTHLGSGRYCPLCVREPDAYGQLLWEVACVKVCPEHRVQLREAKACGAPKGERLPANARPKVSHACSTCGSVGFACVTDELTPAKDEELWVAEQVGKLLAVSPEVSAAWTPTALQQGLRRVVDGVYRGSVVQASLDAGLSRASVCTWVSGKGRPSLAGLMQLCHHARADVVELFGGRFVKAASSAEPVSAAAPLIPEAPHRPAVALIERSYRLRPSNFDPREALESAVHEYPPPNLTQVAGRLGTSTRFLREKWPEQAAALVKASARYRAEQEQARFEAAVSAYERSAQELVEQGTPVTPKYLQRASGLVAFSQNLTRNRAMDGVVNHYAELRAAAATPGSACGEAWVTFGVAP